jgi:hypothetical protein
MGKHAQHLCGVERPMLFLWTKRTAGDGVN